MDDNPREVKDLIFLVGFMGAGKTTVGRALAEKIQYRFIDLDDLIEQATGKTVPEIFAQSGEPVFRQLETEMLRSCKGSKKTVIAVGGGAFIAKENQRIIQEIGRAVWLDCPLPTILSRINLDGSRPLARRESELQELLDRRQQAYACADYSVQVTDLSVEQVVSLIIDLLMLSEVK
jgi:shikimate kinase